MSGQEDKFIKIHFMTEKKEGHGEDAPPLLITKDDAVAVGVFDGMGGAGAAICDSEYGDNYTKAYVVSRIVEKEIESFMEDCLGKEHISAELLKERLVKRLMQEQETFPPKTKSMPLCDVATTHTARKTFIGNLYKKVKDPSLVASLSGHTDGSRAS